MSCRTCCLMRRLTRQLPRRPSLPKMAPPKPPLTRTSWTPNSPRALLPLPRPVPQNTRIKSLPSLQGQSLVRRADRTVTGLVATTSPRQSLIKHQELVTELCHHLSVVITAQANRLAETGLQIRILDREMVGCRRSEVNQAGTSLSETGLQGMALLHLRQGIKQLVDLAFAQLQAGLAGQFPPEPAGQRQDGRDSPRLHATLRRLPGCLHLWLGPTGDRRQQAFLATALAETTERHQPELP